MLGLSVLRNGDSPEDVGAPSGWAGTNTQLEWCAKDGSTTPGAPGALPKYVWCRQSLEQPFGSKMDLPTPPVTLGQGLPGSLNLEG